MLEVYIEKNPTYVSAFKILLAAASPAQRFIQTPVLTHFMINRQAGKILANDGHTKFAESVNYYSAFIDKGVSWADEGFKNMSHFINPKTQRGLYGWTNAARECSLYWNKAIRNWKEGEREKSFFYIGAAIHLVQDLCVPHHAMGILFDGHHDYEDWVKDNYKKYIVEKGGIYSQGDSPALWVRSNAEIAVKFFPMVRAGSNLANYHQATSVLLPRAQKVTAGFLHYFLTGTQLIST